MSSRPPGASCTRSMQTARISSDADSENRGVTAYRSLPLPCQRSIRSRLSASARSGVHSRSSRRIRSLSTRPAVTFSPRASASVNSTSTAGAKCEPKTSAVVVPQASRPSRNSVATTPA